jgi:transcriptional repressor NrdR
MRCVYCGHKNTKVTNKRDIEGNVRRRRECLKCKKRFSTYEKAEIELTIIKKDGRREKFNREKVRSGILKACEKRPVPVEKIEKAVAEIEESLRKRGKEIKSKIIGELIMEKLKKLDKVAYIRFASVYREFKDINDFRKELKEIK